MFAALSEATGLAADLWRQGFAVFLRVGALMALLPGFGEQVVPARVRLVLALALTAVVAPVVTLPDLGLAGYGGEVVAGLVLGLGLRLFIVVLQTAGAIAAQASSLSQILGGAGEPQPAIGHLLTWGGIALAMSAGLHLRVVEALILSYDALPPGAVMSPGVMAEWGVAQVAQAFRLAFSLAAPFVAASLIYNVALGVINKAMPQLMVSMIGAPALTLGGLAMLAVVAPLALSLWLGALHDWLADPFAGAP
nr:flagellar biosynthetic protein FliR [Falsirhodobacter halotolerans]